MPQLTSRHTRQRVHFYINAMAAWLHPPCLIQCRLTFSILAWRLGFDGGSTWRAKCHGEFVAVYEDPRVPPYKNLSIYPKPILCEPAHVCLHPPANTTMQRGKRKVSAVKLLSDPIAVARVVSHTYSFTYSLHAVPICRRHRGYWQHCCPHPLSALHEPFRYSDGESLWLCKLFRLLPSLTVHCGTLCCRTDLCLPYPAWVQHHPEESQREKK